MPRDLRRQPTSAARHHAEWLSLLDVSGPFLSMPVLLRAWPHGLDVDADSPELRRDLRAAYEEWLDNQGGLRPEPAIHRAWVEWALRHVLGMPEEVLHTDAQQLAAHSVRLAEHGETLTPDLAVIDPDSGHPRLLVQIVPAGQSLQRPLAGRRWVAPPDRRLLELLLGTGVALGLVTNGEQWTLVHAPRGQTSTYVSWYAELWLEEPLTLRAFQSLLSAYRTFGVADEETLEGLLAASADQQQEVTEQLGYQVRRAVELVVQAVDLADQDRGRALLAGVSETDLYEAAVTVMMRLVFLFSAEEKGLLLLGDPLYDEHYAVSTLRAQLHERADQLGEEVLERRTDAWCRLLATFRAVYGGIRHDRLQLPAYGGGLFDPDRYPFLEGRARRTPASGGAPLAPAQPLPIDNRTVLHLLDALQMLQVPVQGGPAEARRLSFRALDIEQIGHVYEGLLDHTAVRAEGPVLGLQGTRDKEPEIPLETLVQECGRGEDAFLAYLHGETGRSTSALRRALDAGADLERAPRLRTACGNDEALYARILPFAGLVRDDDYGQPVVIRAGSVYVTAGRERRATGTHYTPRSLTEPIVQHTLEPLVYAGPAEGQPPDEWVLRPASELLSLKVCDMAMGSGAFLVQACRYLAERLMGAWAEAERANTARKARWITTEGGRTANPDEAIPADDGERLLLAHRLVADRCLYGVDKNPLAVEMAKLSLWLVTLQKNRPFTFLDHALKCGDSLVGMSRAQLQYWTLHPEPGAARHAEPFGTAAEFERVIALRREVAGLPERDIRDTQLKAQKLADAERITHNLRAGGDLLVASYLSGKKGKAADKLRDALWRTFRFGEDEPEDAPDLDTVVAGGLRPFHWELEFPEVFEKRGGFDAFVGNPPFIGGKRIRETLGDRYREVLYDLYPGSAGGADYCAFFFLRAFAHLRPNGALGLVATNTIAQGDSRETGLQSIVANSGTIYRATVDQPWPGQAAVVVDVVHIYKGSLRPPYVLGEKAVGHVSSLLDSHAERATPRRLLQNKDKSFIGSFVNGIGFVVTPDEAEALIAADPRNRDVLFLYLNGEDLNSSPDQSPSRWVINFFDWPLERAETYLRPMAIVRERVYPARARVTREAHRKYWWHYGDKRPALYRTIAPLRRVLVIAQTSRTLAFAFVPRGIVYSHMTVVIASDEDGVFAALQSDLHVCWTLKNASSLKGDARYIPSDCFENYPFPQDVAQLQGIGEAYHEERHQLMLARQEGLTATYNRFHDPAETAEDIVRLRALHVEMDQAVAAAYSWQDLDLGHGFHQTPQGMRYTISATAKDEVLDRLWALNQERYEEEVRQGLQEGENTGGRASALREDKGQYTLFQ